MAHFIGPGVVAFAGLIASGFGQSPPNCPSPNPVMITNMTGPIIPGDYVFADPSIHNTPDGMIYVYGTNIGAVNVPFASSASLNAALNGYWNVTMPDGTRWDALPNGAGNWTASDPAVWNPDVARLSSNAQFVMYYSAKRNPDVYNGNDERCIGVAFSSTPDGPFVPKDQPLYCPDSGGAIGVDSVVDTYASNRYLLFKNPSCPGTAGPNCVAKLKLFEIASNGLTPNYPNPPTDIDTLTIDNIGSGEESPALTHESDGRWLLLHTEGTYAVNYRIVYALTQNTDNNIEGTYNDYEDCVLAQSGDPAYVSINSTQQEPLYCPGGPDFFGGDGSKFIFAAFTKDPNQNPGAHRQLYYGELSYTPSSTKKHAKMLTV